MSKVAFLGFLGLVLFLGVNPAQGQDKVKFSGTIFSDYSYTFSSPDGSDDGKNGFDYRRVYFTTDYKVSDKFSARVRFEGADKTVISDGKPVLFVKDLYLKWNSALGEGHNIVFGVSSPPLWTAAEKQWAYRGLEATIMNRSKVASSRDMGIAFQGPLTGDNRIKYSFMFANNSGVKQETDRFKRLYGQLEFLPTESLNFTLGGDMYSFEGGNSLGLNGFVGYTMSNLVLGLEGYYNPKTFEGSDNTDNKIGVSLFGRYNVDEKHRVIARCDLMEHDNAGVTTQNGWFILGFSSMPEKGIEIIPNIIWDKNDADSHATLTGRLTVIASF